MNKRLLPFMISALLLTALKVDKPAYQFFNMDGRKVKYSKVLKEALEADIVFFGELHNNPVCHWLELELAKDMFDETGTDLVIGVEMFESDDQMIIDEYFSGLVGESNFEKEAKLWNNYKTDYKPLVDFARNNNIKFIATNIPRRYASLVNKKGFEGLDSLSSDAKKLIAPLPVDYDAELKGYKQMLEMMGGMGHAGANLPKAQAIKDATMAYFIMQNWTAGKIFIHYNGSYHSQNFEGIVWYLKNANPMLKILTISSEEQADLDTLDQKFMNTANFILVIPDDMTKTY